MSIYASKRWIWVTACQNFGGNEPPFGKILAYDSPIHGVYVNGTPRADSFSTAAFTYSPEDPYAAKYDWQTLKAPMMERIRSFGLLAGAWFVPRTTNAVIEANKAANMVTRLNPDAVMLDVETHDVAFQRAFIAEYRRLKPGRATDWTMEPRQGPDTVAIQEILDARMDIFPQLYRDNMRPSDPKHELWVWCMWPDGPKVDPHRVHLFLDAKQDWWNLDDGALFTAETLPDKRALTTRLLARVAPKRAHTRLAETLPTLGPQGDELEDVAA